MILRALFWLIAMTILFPQDQLHQSSESTVLGGAVQTGALEEVRAIALNNVVRLKQLRAAQNRPEADATD